MKLKYCAIYNLEALRLDSAVKETVQDYFIKGKK